jgi:hypothetical protein
MPTVAESTWLETRERIQQAVKNFVEARFRDIDDSEDILSARLFALGLRGQDLKAEVYRAATLKFERLRCPSTLKVCISMKMGGKCNQRKTCDESNRN